MNANRIIDMVVRQVMRRLVNSGVNKGFDLAGRMTQKKGEEPSAPTDPAAAKRVQGDAKQQGQNMKNVQRMTKQMRRFIRF